MNKENETTKGFSITKLMLCLVAVFFLFIAYKYISSGIQENKEKAVIQERANVQQTSAQAIPKKKAVLPENTVLPNDRASCSLQNEINSAKEWTHACYLRDLLTPQCKQIFDADGYYLTDKYDPIAAPNGYVDLYTYLNNADICKCRLPTDIADSLNSSQAYAEARCNKIPPLKIL